MGRRPPGLYVPLSTCHSNEQKAQSPVLEAAGVGYADPGVSSGGRVEFILTSELVGLGLVDGCGSGFRQRRLPLVVGW